MLDLVFITDTHFCSKSNVRTGDVIQDYVTKMKFVVDYCNKHNAILLHGGDLFDKPSVPDQVKNAIFPVFRELKNPCYAIAGNHSILYDNSEYNFKTSYQVMESVGLITDLDKVPYVDLGECVLTSQVPIINHGKPQIVVYHGFLNAEDRWSLSTADIHTNQPCYILLGHDHVVYEPLQYTANVKIFRPGSFLRQTRNAEHLRIPEMLHIRVDDKGLHYKMVPISVARPADEIFLTKETTISKSQQRDTYEDIISQIRSANATSMSFPEALASVASEDVCNYANRILEDYRMQKAVDKGKL